MTTTQLTFTRFIAAFLLFVYHFGHINNGEHFNLGVGYFYVLSGFVMMLAYGKKDNIAPKKYYLNRIARIYPLHLLTLLLSLLAYIFKNINYLGYLKFDPPSLIANALLVQSWIPSMSLTYNVPSWSISVEMFFYLLFPFLFNYIVTRWKFKYLFISVLGFWLVCQMGMNWYYFSEYYGGYDSLSRYFLKYNPFLHLNSFLVGILFGSVFHNIHQFKLKAKNYDFAIILMVIINITFIYLTRNIFIHNGLHAISFGLIILLITLNTGMITKIFNHKKLIYLGEISFAFYLLQVPISEIVSKIFKKIRGGEDFWYFSILFIIVLVASHIAYKYIEIPIKNKIKNLIK